MRAASLGLVGLLGLAGGAYAAGGNGTQKLPRNPCELNTTTVVQRTVRTTETVTVPSVTTSTLTTTAPVTTPTTTGTTTTGTTTTGTTTTPVSTVPTTTVVTTTVPVVTTVQTTTTVAQTRTVPVAPAWQIPRHSRAITREPGYTVVAEARVAGPVRRAPGRRARVITKLRFFTQDQQAVQTYLVIAERRIHRAHWVLIELPMRPDGTIGWVPRSYLAQFITNREEIVVNRAAHTLVLCRGGKAIFHARVGNGKPSTPTPAGHFWITEAFTSTNPFYGPFAFGTSDYAHDTQFLDGSVVGIHGTNSPWLIPGAPSHGCVRLQDPEILKLSKLVTIGAGVWIQ